MTLDDISPREREDEAKYMMVICLLNKTDKTRNDIFTTPPALSITVSMQSEPISSVTTMSTKESAPATMIPCSTATAAQLHPIAAAKKKREYNTAFKRATLMYAQKKEKGKMGMSARNVTELIRNEFKVNLCPQTIQKKVKEGNIGCLLLRRGPQGYIPEQHYSNLCLAFESFICINQINGMVRELEAKKVGPRLHNVIYSNKEGGGVDCWRHLLVWVLGNTAIDLQKAKSQKAEDKRIRWTNHKNITMWFNNLEDDLVELGFAMCDQETGKLHISDKQLGLIGNFNETCLNLDGSSTNCGGCPEAYIYDP
jgi:hypothetical protein